MLVWSCFFIIGLLQSFSEVTPPLFVRCRQGLRTASFRLRSWLAPSAFPYPHPPYSLFALHLNKHLSLQVVGFWQTNNLSWLDKDKGEMLCLAVWTPNIRWMRLLREADTFCLAMVCLVESNSECSRMLFQGAVRIDGY